MININRGVSDILAELEDIAYGVHQCSCSRNHHNLILVEKAFSDNWFNDTYNLNLSKDQLWELLELATTNQLFQLNGTLCHFMSKTYFQMWTLFHIILLQVHQQTRMKLFIIFSPLRQPGLKIVLAQ